MVGDHVGDEPEAALVGGGGQGAEARLAAEHGGDVGVVDDVVEVGASRRRAQDGGEVDVGDAQGGDVVEVGSGVGEGEVGVQLDAVGGDGDRRVGAVAEPAGSLVAGLARVECAR